MLPSKTHKWQEGPEEVAEGHASLDDSQKAVTVDQELRHNFRVRSMNRVNPKAPPPRQSRQETHMQGDTYSSFEDIQETDVQRTKLIIEAKVSRMDAMWTMMWTAHCHHHATFPIRMPTYLCWSSSNGKGQCFNNYSGDSALPWMWLMHMADFDASLH